MQKIKTIIGNILYFPITLIILLFLGLFYICILVGFIIKAPIDKIRKKLN